MPHAARRVLGGLSVMVALGALVALALPVRAAHAGVINLNPCNGAALSQPFAPWADPAWYELAPGGDFESSTWTVTGGAQLIEGSEPYAATGTQGSWSLSLPAGSSAQSPVTCVDAAYPTIRFFVAGSGLVAVTVVDGNLNIPAGIAVASGDWRPTAVMLTGSALTGAASDGTAQVSLRVIAVIGDPHIDDVFIDPWNRG